MHSDMSTTDNAAFNNTELLLFSFVAPQPETIKFLLVKSSLATFSSIGKQIGYLLSVDKISC